jgi:hypothetical protein
MSLLSEVMTPFRGLGGSCRRVARKVASRDLPAGFGVIIKGVAGLVARGVRAGWAASGSTPPPAEKPAKEGEKTPDPSKIKKGKAAGEKATPKDPSAADRAEAAGVMVLCTVIVIATLGTALATLGPRLAPYAPTAGAVSAAGLLIAAWIVAPQKQNRMTTVRAAQLTDEQRTFLDRMTLLGILDRATVRRNGVHLGELHQHLTAHPRFAALQRVHVGALLEGFGVPVQRTLSVDGIEGRSGVRRDDVTALVLALPQKGQAPPSQPSESGSDQQESQPLSDRSQPALGPLSEGV